MLRLKGKVLKREHQTALLSSQGRLAVDPRHQPGRQLDMWRGWLCDPQIEPRKRLLEVISHAKLPGHLLHHFACDCAARALTQARLYHGQLKPLLEQAINAKRAWIEGTQNAHELHHYHQHLKQRSEELPLVRQKQLALTVSWTMSLAPPVAARYASRYVFQEAERDWHCRQLIHLIEQLQHIQSRLLRLLKHREREAKGTLAYWQTSYEEPLFHL